MYEEGWIKGSQIAAAVWWLLCVGQVMGTELCTKLSRRQCYAISRVCFCKAVTDHAHPPKFRMVSLQWNEVFFGTVREFYKMFCVILGFREGQLSSGMYDLA